MKRCLPLLGLLGGVALAHGAAGDADGATPLWLALGLTALALLYAGGLARLWRRAGPGRGVSVARAAAFFAGLLVLAAALLALDHLADESFAWHMVQHLLLVMVAAPLLVLGWPLYVLGWTLPLGWRRGVARAWNRAPLWRAVWKGLNRPVLAWLLATGVFWAWHAPPLFDAAARDGRLHALEHLSFLATSALFWWVVLRPAGRRALSRGAAVLYLFAAALQASLLGALLTFARAPLYPDYTHKALAAGHDPLADQQLAGLVMWVPMDVVFLAFASVVFLRWLAGEEEAQRAREGLSPPEKPPA